MADLFKTQGKEKSFVVRLPYHHLTLLSNEESLFYYEHLRKLDKTTAVDKTRTMEDSGTSRNIPERPGTWKNYHKYENNM